MMSAYSRPTHLLDLPDELLVLILKQLDDIDILSSFFDIGHDRLHRLTRHKTSPTHLHFPLSLLSDSRFGAHFQRLTQHIFPHIHHRVASLTLPGELLERVLLPDRFPNLSELTLYNFRRDTSLHHFTDESSLAATLKKQIRKLSVISEDPTLEHRPWEDYTERVHSPLFACFDCLEEFHVLQRPLEEYPPLTIRRLPADTFASAQLTSLSIFVETWSDCLCLLDGRLEQLRTFNVEMESMKTDPSISDNADDLPKLVSFSFIYYGSFDKYPTQIRSLLQRMIFLQRLTLHVQIDCADVFIDPLDLIEQLTSDMSQLHTLNFYVNTTEQLAQPSRRSFERKVPRHEQRKRYGQVWSHAVHDGSTSHHHAFTLPFQFKLLHFIDRQFPETRFQHVVELVLRDALEFDHHVFLRVARCFPFLQHLILMEDYRVRGYTFDEIRAILRGDEAGQIAFLKSFDDPPSIRVDHVVRFPHLKTLDLSHTGLRCAEQFLNEHITHLPRLTELTIMYHNLEMITKDFTRQETRRNCAHVTKLEAHETTVGSKDFYDHFPSL